MRGFVGAGADTAAGMGKILALAEDGCAAAGRKKNCSLLPGRSVARDARSHQRSRAAGNDRDAKLVALEQTGALLALNGRVPPPHRRWQDVHASLVRHRKFYL
jgi:hypothetical protein